MYISISNYKIEGEDKWKKRMMKKKKKIANTTEWTMKKWKRKNRWLFNLWIFIGTYSASCNWMHREIVANIKSETHCERKQKTELSAEYVLLQYWNGWSCNASATCFNSWYFGRNAANWNCYIQKRYKAICWKFICSNIHYIFIQFNGMQALCDGYHFTFHFTFNYLSIDWNAGCMVTMNKVST